MKELRDLQRDLVTELVKKQEYRLASQARDIQKRMVMRTPRKLKKARSKVRMIFDLAALPINMDVETWLSWYNTHGIVWYTEKGSMPQILNKRNAKLQLNKLEEDANI